MVVNPGSIGVIDPRETPPVRNKKRRNRRERVAVIFQADSSEGQAVVHALLKSGSRAAAITNSLNVDNAAHLLEQKRVLVKVFDTTDRVALAKSIRGADRVILVTKYWETFENVQEEKQALTLIDACNDVGIKALLFSSIEDTKKKLSQGVTSQIVANERGEISPTFDGMIPAKKKAKRLGVHLNHMITSYVETNASKTSLCLICGENGKLIVAPSVEKKRRHREVSSTTGKEATASRSRSYKVVERSSWAHPDIVPGILLTIFMAIFMGGRGLLRRLPFLKMSFIALILLSIGATGINEYCHKAYPSSEPVTRYEPIPIFFF